MTEKQLALKIEQTALRYGPAQAVGTVLASLCDADILSLWEFVGPRVIREVWRRNPPQLEIVTSIKGVLRQLVALGTSGGKKALGAVTAPELFIIAQFRSRMGETLTEQARVLRRIGHIIGDRTVGEAWEEINAAGRRALLDAFGISAPKKAASLSA